MNTRLLGTLCMIGSAVWMLDGVRQAALGLHEFDKLSNTANLVWAIGGFCGILGLVTAKATGTNPIFRVLTFLPAVGFLMLITGASLRLMGVIVNASGNWVSGVGWLLILAGTLVVGILTLAITECKYQHSPRPFRHSLQLTIDTSRAASQNALIAG